jgi:hypothetical protein
MFVNLAGQDYRLQSSSPANGAGISLGYAYDYAGTAIPSGAAPDLGAIERL